MVIDNAVFRYAIVDVSATDGVHKTLPYYQMCDSQDLAYALANRYRGYGKVVGVASVLIPKEAFHEVSKSDHMPIAFILSLDKTIDKAYDQVSFTTDSPAQSLQERNEGGYYSSSPTSFSDAGANEVVPHNNQRTARKLSRHAQSTQQLYQQNAKPFLGTTNVRITSIDPVARQVVEKLRQTNPQMFKDVFEIKIVAHGNALGWVSNQEPNTIYLNVQRIKDEVKKKLGQDLNPSSPEHQQVLKEAREEALASTYVHEHAHVQDYDPQRGIFPGGEPVAERATQEFISRSN